MNEHERKEEKEIKKTIYKNLEIIKDAKRQIHDLKNELVLLKGDKTNTERCQVIRRLMFEYSIIIVKTKKELSELREKSINLGDNKNKLARKRKNIENLEFDEDKQNLKDFIGGTCKVEDFSQVRVPSKNEI